jgi:hypothetical protein
VRCLLFLSFACTVCAQGTIPRKSAAEYPVHGKSGSIEIGAEFMVHSFSRGEASYIAADYLVVEVGLFPAGSQNLAVNPAEFRLRVNGGSKELTPENPGVVAVALTHPDWKPGSYAEIGAGLGHQEVVLGRPTQRPPDFPVPGQGPSPPSRIPQGVPSPVEQTEPEKPEQLVVETALPAGEHSGPVSGFLYFAYRGKVKSIKKLEVLDGDLVLRLR